MPHPTWRVVSYHLKSECIIPLEETYNDKHKWGLVFEMFSMPDAFLVNWLCELLRFTIGAREGRNLACEQAPGGASAEQTFGAKRRAIRRFAPNVCSALAPPGACSQARRNPLIVPSVTIGSTQVKVHTTLKPYNLAFCEKALKISYELQIHKRPHTEEKPFIYVSCVERDLQQKQHHQPSLLFIFKFPV